MGVGGSGIGVLVGVGGAVVGLGVGAGLVGTGGACAAAPGGTPSTDAGGVGVGAVEASTVSSTVAAHAATRMVAAPSSPLTRTVRIPGPTRRAYGGVLPPRERAAASRASIHRRLGGVIPPRAARLAVIVTVLAAGCSIEPIREVQPPRTPAAEPEELAFAEPQSAGTTTAPAAAIPDEGEPGAFTVATDRATVGLHSAPGSLYTRLDTSCQTCHDAQVQGYPR